ncbi:hypothetical protein NUSPORA_02598 [Nucleospora cyclopteri]
MEKYELDCYVTFNSDCHLNECLAHKDCILEKLTGFSGSNGTALTCKDNPLLLTDTRYYIQAQRESSYKLCKEKLSIALKNFKKISFDLKTISMEDFKILKGKMDEYEIGFIETPGNLLKSVLETIEEESTEKVNEGINEEIRINDIIYLENYKLADFVTEIKIEEHLKSYGINPAVFDQNVTGSSYLDKICKIRAVIGEKTLIVTEMDTIAWILNIRGSDIMHTPVFFSYLVISKETVILFTDSDVYLKGILIKKYGQFENYLLTLIGGIKAKKLGSNKSVNSNENPFLISGECNYFIYKLLDFPSTTHEIREMQTVKNETELAGMILSYFYDGIALTNVLGECFESFNGEKRRDLTEEQIAEILVQFKKPFNGFIEPSFDTISSTGLNAAIVHHRASEAVVDPGKVFLIDSGSQYLFGTTDTTRTCLFVNDAENREENYKEYIRNLIHDFTLVLKCHLNPIIQKYSLNSSMGEIYENGEIFLKQEQKGFGHSISHGVGHCLNVHEDPPIISKSRKHPFKDNYCFSVEPGYYTEKGSYDGYGIRLENLVFSKQSGDFFQLVNYTMVPYDLALIDISMLTDEEIDYLNKINEKIYNLLKDHVTPEGYKYLYRNTRTIEKSNK